MKIKRPDFNQLRNLEHFQLLTEFKTLVEGFDDVRQKISALFDDYYIPLYNAEDEALVKITKNSTTGIRRDADRLRSRTFRGLVDMVNAGLNHFAPEMRSAARRVKIVFDTYGNVAKLSLNEKTSAIYNLVHELLDNYAEDAEMLGIVAWINQLDADNADYKMLVAAGNEEDAAKTGLKAKTTRAEADRVMRRMIERVEALMVIEGNDDYSEFVRRLNLHFDMYANILAQREGVAKARREKQKIIDAGA